MGVIADRAKAYIPISWDALSGDDRYGDTVIQERIEQAKYQTLGDAAPLEGAEGTLNKGIQEFIAKKAVILIIPGAIEFWMGQPISVTATGTQEITVYEERVATLRKLLEQLIAEVSAEEAIIDLPVLTKQGFIKVSDGQADNLITPNPHTFPPAFDLGEET